MADWLLYPGLFLSGGGVLVCATALLVDWLQGKAE